MEHLGFWTLPTKNIVLNGFDTILPINAVLVGFGVIQAISNLDTGLINFSGFVGAWEPIYV
jgi:hypothetical protein